METRPLVSVIMPCYNMERFIAESMDSVRQQTFPHWELLIVDDHSTDHTVDQIKPYTEQDERIKLLVKDHHSGIADSRNQAIRMAQGRFLAFLDADDLWHPEKLEVQLDFMKRRSVGFSYSSYECVDENSIPKGKVVMAVNDLKYESYLRNTVIGCSTVMIDRTLVGEVTVPDFRTSEDTATWLTLLKKGFLAYAIQQVLVSYRIRKKSASSNKWKASSDLWRVYRDHEQLPFFKAVFYFCSYAFHALKKHLF